MMLRVALYYSGSPHGPVSAHGSGKDGGNFPLVLISARSWKKAAFSTICISWAKMEPSIRHIIDSHWILARITHEIEWLPRRPTAEPGGKNDAWFGGLGWSGALPQPSWSPLPREEDDQVPNDREEPEEGRFCGCWVGRLVEPRGPRVLGGRKSQMRSFTGWF